MSNWQDLKDDLAFVDKIDMTGDCWIWTGSVSPNGYGRMQHRGRQRYAHRVVWEESVEPIPDGLTIDHLCRNRLCVNPDHLEVVSMRENILRGESPSAVHYRRSCCNRGHPFTEENTGRRLDGGRKCRACAREVMRRCRERRFLFGEGDR